MECYFEGQEFFCIGESGKDNFFSGEMFDQVGDLWVSKLQPMFSVCTF